MQIRPLRTSREFRACEDIQTEVWGKVAASAELMKVTQEHGGMVLGALKGAQVYGFIYAFLARYHGRLIQWSHVMAVREGFRDQGLGFLMKRAHRRLALAQGIASICWTYDPLQSRNAALNISRLGAEIAEYVPDCYGEFPSVIERGLPSDRFVVNWRIASARVAKHLRRKRLLKPIPPLPIINRTGVNARGFLQNLSISHKVTAPKLLVEIPAEPDVMRNKAIALARRWRMETRRIFQSHFRAGYRIADFLREPDGERCFYVLARRQPV